MALFCRSPESHHNPCEVTSQSQRTMKRTAILSLPFILAVFAAQSLCAAEISAVRVGSKINVTINGKYFTSYIFSEDEKYPFFFPLNGPASGASVTSMRNGLYPHHSSLFLGCDRVNGGDYWQEGLERGRIVSVNAGIVKQGGDTVEITDECIWSRPGATSPVRDMRRFVITVPSENMVQIDVTLTMEMLEDVHILRTNHSLFSARMAADLSVTYGGTMINAEWDLCEKGTFGKNSSWIDYYGRRGDVIEGLAIMQHPSNPWYPSPWFTRDYGFMSPTPMNWPENGEETCLKQGERLRLRYRVLVHTGEPDEAGITERFNQFSMED
jgi:hypothetical protein